MNKSQKMKLLDKWLEDLVFPEKTENIIQFYKTNIDDKGVTVKFFFYTDDNRYSIVARDSIDNDGYLGCQVTSRKMRPGEDWNRGNDLPDGPFTEETWKNILTGIVKYELVKLSTFSKTTKSIPDINTEDIL